MDVRESSIPKLWTADTNNSSTRGVETGSAFVTMRDDTGEGYTGFWDWSKNRAQGTGSWTYPNNDICKGTFDKGKACGMCEYHFNNGDYYKGHMKHGKAHGFGKKVFCDGSTYEGGFSRDQYEGTGTFVHRSMIKGDHFMFKRERGKWKKGEMINGFTTLYEKDGSVTQWHTIKLL